jgi:ATP-dependent Zn protease
MNEGTVNQVIDKSFQITADTVYGALVAFMFIVLIVLVFFLSRERKDRKDATKQLMDVTQSYATTFAQVNETIRSLNNDVKGSVDKILHHLNIN